MDDCLFCKIIAGTIPSTKVFEDYDYYAFRDIAPQSPIHIILVPKRHISNLNEILDVDDNITAHLLKTTAIIAKQEKIEKTGYRVVSNCGKDAQQSVNHLHFHIMGGGQLSGKMG